MTMNYTLITGASSGLGRELAVYLSAKRNLIITGRDSGRIAETISLCSADTEIIAWPYDLKDIASLEKDFASFIEAGKYAVDSFVHCAGMMSMLPLRSITPEIINATYSVNVFSAAVIMKILASRKINGRNFRSAVLVSSNISNRGARAFSVYGSSKAALDGLARNLAVELAPGVRVNTVQPGAMRSRMTQEIFADEALIHEAGKKYPLGIGSTGDVVPAVEFLLSDGARWITGQNIVTDGGRIIDITER